MGGNGAYSFFNRGVLSNKRTHTDTFFRIGGHKVLLQKKQPKQRRTPMNSNSESPVYLIASIGKDGTLTINTIASYSRHKVEETVDLEFDKEGNYIAYDKTERSSHSHNWSESDSGVKGRTSHDETNRNPVDSKYDDLIADIVDFNKSRRKWK